MRDLNYGDRGSDVRELQHALNARSAARGRPSVSPDGVLGAQTKEASERIGRELGALEETLQRSDIPVGLQRMIRWPEGRSKAQLARAKSRRGKVARKTQRKVLRLDAFHEAQRLVGVMERGGNNRGAEVEAIIRAGGGQAGQAWCGWFNACCYRRAGSKAVTWRWGAVRLYLPGTGLKRTTEPLRGNIVRFTFDHTGMFDAWCDARGNIVPRAQATHIRTIEGNTGASGAVSDSKTGGDGVYMKVRPRSLVRDFISVSK